MNPSHGAYEQGREGGSQSLRLKGQGSSCPVPPSPCSLLLVGAMIPVSAICCHVLKEPFTDILPSSRAGDKFQPSHPFTSIELGAPLLGCGALPDSGSSSESVWPQGFVLSVGVSRVCAGLPREAGTWAWGHGLCGLVSGWLL